MAKKTSTTVAIKYKPNTKVKNLVSPTRDGLKFSYTWRPADKYNNSKNNRRWQSLYSVFTPMAGTLQKNCVDFTTHTVKVKDKKTGKNKSVVQSNLKPYKTVKKSYGAGQQKLTRSLSRSDYYPGNVSNDKPEDKTLRALDKVTLALQAKNNKGSGPSTSVDYKMGRPADPKITVSYDASTGIVKFDVETDDKSKTNQDRLDTYYVLTVKDGSTTDGTYRSVTETTGRNTNLKFSVSRNIANANVIPRQGSIEVILKAYNRGVRGRSNTKTATRVLCQPAEYDVISPISVVGTGSGDDTDREKTVFVRTKKFAVSKYLSTDSVQLQRLKNTDATTAVAAAVEEGWTDVENAIDDATTNGLTDSYLDALPIEGFHTWYRFMSKHDNYRVYSTPVEATILYRSPPPTPTASDEIASIREMKTHVYRETNVETGEETVKAYLELGIGNKLSGSTGTLDCDGVELSWSENEYAWQSIDSQPSTYNIDWWDKTSRFSGYPRSTTAYLYELDYVTPYYFQTRCYKEDSGDSGNETDYGSYSAPGVSNSWPYMIANDKEFVPRDVKITVPKSIARGEEIPVSWTYESDTPIQEWKLFGYHTSGNGAKVFGSSAPNTPDEYTTSLVIPASDIYKTDTVMSFYVQLKNKAGWSSVSDEPDATANLIVFDNPSISVTSSNKLTAQPYTFRLNVTKNHESLLPVQNNRVCAKVKAKGVVYQTPDGEEVQATDDVVWSDILTPTNWVVNWSADMSSITSMYVDVTLPSSLNFIDTARYILEVYVESDVGTQAGGTTEVEKWGTVKSGTVSKEFQVEWTHQALPPSDDSYAVGYLQSLSTKVLPVAPDGAKATDVCDIYRVTPDGAYLIAENAMFGKPITDRFAPFSKVADLRYRICTRTIDGDIAWSDVPYNIKYHPIRFDWGRNRSLELPYNIKFNDSFEKDFESRQHLDGGHPGYWNPGSKRSSSLSTQLIRLDEPQQQELVREMAQYSGPIFVRTPDGCAYMANVDVSGIDNSYDSLVMDVSLNATEVDLTEEFMVAVGDMVRVVT